jgi:hypothetical protein
MGSDFIGQGGLYHQQAGCLLRLDRYFLYTGYKE